MSMLDGKVILITGGTGSFGKKLVETVLKQYRPLKLIVYSRDELKQFEMSQHFPEAKYPCMRYFIGDVRDRDRLSRAFEGVDIVVHAAALKQVPAAEYNPFEAVKTNIGGAQNVIDASIERGVKRVIALSTDKAAAPINLYGATKLASDKLFVAANNHKGSRDLRFSVVRYGNVMGSRGSVIPFFRDKAPSGVLPVTDPRMTRFNITLQQGVDFVLENLRRMWGGEIFVPKIPSYRILDVAEAVAPGCRVEVVGIRPGEKLHEEMITETDALSTFEFDSYYVILPSVRTWDFEEFRIKSGSTVGQLCPEGFKYSSSTNSEWLGVADLRVLIKENLG
jgi:UDP-N-acetylglucosamine 4,6-dehydratase/5-epimerase